MNRDIFAPNLSEQEILEIYRTFFRWTREHWNFSACPRGADDHTNQCNGCVYNISVDGRNDCVQILAKRLAGKIGNEFMTGKLRS